LFFGIRVLPASVLFIHQAGPAQFVHVIQYMSDHPDQWSPYLLRMVGCSSDKLPPNCTVFEYRPTRSNSSAEPLTADVESKLIRGESVLYALEEIVRQNHYKPDLIVVHPGWGEALFLREIYPDVPQLHYCEYYYASSGQDIGFDPVSPASRSEIVKALSKNLNLSYSLLHADAYYSPTHWQASTFPADHRSRIHIIHDGVNTDELDCYRNDFLRNKHVSASDSPVITYVNRAFEPSRGAHIFCQALPEVLKRHENVSVHIIGGASTQLPYSQHKSTDYLRNYLHPLLNGSFGSRIRHSPSLNRSDYLHALSQSACHVYLTIPFVLSWSLIEAMGLGLPIVASNTKPVQEVIQSGHNGLLVDFHDHSALASAMLQCLENTQLSHDLSQAAYSSVQTQFSLHSVTLPKLIRLMRSLLI